MFIGNKKCRIYAACGVSQTPIKMIYERKQKRLAQGKKCTATDARYFQMAENLLYMELGVALGKPKEEICKTIINYINQSKQEN